MGIVYLMSYSLLALCYGYCVSHVLLAVSLVPSSSAQLFTHVVAEEPGNEANSLY